VTRRPPAAEAAGQDLAGQLTGLLADGAAGLLAEAAAVQLLAGHGCWLARADFTGTFIAAGPSPLSGQPLAHVRWKAAARALAGGQLPASRTEQAILRIAASLAAGVPVRLGDAVTGLDHANMAAVTTAIWRAGGHRPR
jgi:hypothetical protein